MVSTHLAVRTTAQRHICKDCGKKRWGPQSPRSRAACPAAPGRASRTVVAGEEGEAAGRAAEDSGTGTMTPNGCPPSGQRECRKRGKSMALLVSSKAKLTVQLKENATHKHVGQTKSNTKWCCCNFDHIKLQQIKHGWAHIPCGTPFSYDTQIKVFIISTDGLESTSALTEHLICTVYYCIKNALETHTC